MIGDVVAVDVVIVVVVRRTLIGDRWRRYSVAACEAE